MKKLSLLDGIVYTLFGLFIIINFISLLNDNLNLLIAFSFFIIGIISYVWFIMDNSFISINKLIAMFIFLFCYLAPFYQYTKELTFWGMPKFNDAYYLNANLLIILFLIVYLISYYIIFKKIKATPKKTSDFYITSSSMFILVLLAICCFGYLYITGNLIEEGGYSKVADTSITVVLIKIIRFFPISVLLLTIFSYKKKTLKIKKNYFKLVITILGMICLMIFNPLTGTISRYLVLGTYIILLSAVFTDSRNKSLILIFTLIGFIVIFPSMNFFRYTSFENIENFKFEIINLEENDYDAYYMFVSTIRYVDCNGVSFGSNLLSALLSFVPRSIWNGKNLPSGEIVADFFGARFTNVSCPVFAEFYFAFKEIGIVLGAFLMALIIKYVTINKEKNYILSGIYCIVVGLIIAFMRGAMLPMSSFITTLIVSYAISYFIAKFIWMLKLSSRNN